ncbi:hypothetical protein VCRA2110O173_690004 [Vibrio crassostreae]|nr:hypothetical protein VCRA2119O381_2230004 [Vibrio crassostreae]CAK2198865.1 hypothetical protein VCRA2110O173_690004 [Vibrio crassostreae]CAK2897237.1 hypothetical protein VCRA2119O149_4130001 [Vibrio crassostreae]CAK3150053.1 hypothetical protein VCRA2127O302_620002 [Vibrio crassostreae]
MGMNVVNVLPPGKPYLDSFLLVEQFFDFLFLNGKSFKGGPYNEKLVCRS